MQTDTGTDKESQTDSHVHTHTYVHAHTHTPALTTERLNSILVLAQATKLLVWGTYSAAQQNQFSGDG